MSDVESIPDETLDGLLDEVQEVEAEHPASEDEAAEAPGQDAEKKTVKPKRVIKNPRPKLNEQTLKTPRGLPAIEKCFDRVKFKGKGHEDKDLDVLMKTYEYWCHRMFPKYPFDACIEKLEKLGTKKATQVYLKRIRMGIADNDHNDEVSSGKEDENVLTDGFIDQFDRVASQPALNEEDMERIRRNREQAEEKRRQRLEQNIGKTGVNSELTQEQMERIRINKENAERLRKKRQQRAEEEVQLDQMLEDINENDPTPVEAHKRLQPQTLDSDDETEEFHSSINTRLSTSGMNETRIEINTEAVEDVQLNPIVEDISEKDQTPNKKNKRLQLLNSNEGLKEPQDTRKSKTSTAYRGEENSKPSLEVQSNHITRNNETDPILIRKHKRLQMIDSDEEIEETHYINKTTTVDKNETEIQNEELHLNEIMEDINDDAQILNKKRKRSQVLNSDEEMEGTQCITNNKAKAADRNDCSNEETIELVLGNQEEIPLDQTVTEVSNLKRKKLHVDEDMEESHD